MVRYWDYLWACIAPHWFVLASTLGEAVLVVKQRCDILTSADGIYSNGLYSNGPV